MRRPLALAAVATLWLPGVGYACPVCFGASDGPMLQGSNIGILALLIVTLAVLGGFAAFFAVLARRSRLVHGDARPQHVPFTPGHGGLSR